MGTDQSEHPEGAWGELRSPRILEAILDSAAQCILAVGRDGRILAANAKSEAMFGYTPEELQGKPVEVLVPETVVGIHQKHRDGYFEAPRVRPMGAGVDLVARRKDGSEFPVEISLSHAVSGDERLAIAFVSDITQRKTLEVQLTQAQKLEAIGRLAGGIAHDFNNLLTIITGYDRFLLDRLSTMDPLRANAEEIMKAAERASAMTKQLLAFSRRQIVQPKIVDLNRAVRDSEQMVRRLMGENIELVYRLSSNVGRVRIDPSQLDQVVLNLLINARDALPRGGRVTVETERVQLDEDYAKTHVGVIPGPFTMLAVTDNGLGIDRSVQDHIFEPFFTTKSADRGSGLGLATVYGIVKQNGGDIWVYSEVGKGTTFKIYLPKVQRKGEAETTASDVSDRRGGSETVLVVEDERGVRDLICTLLGENGYRVLATGSPRDALEISRGEQGTVDLLWCLACRRPVRGCRRACRRRFP
jgi:two-component system, cell cycle sensor histidine kinase and response regulator CckA